MAKKEIVNVITIKTEESQNTIKGLKKEIADLKKNLDNAVIGSDEFEKASKDLAKAQNDLKTVLADGKKQTDNVEGSYNHLVSTMAELKKEWRATADEVKRNEIGKEIDRINTELKELDSSIGNYQRNVGDYANSFKEAFEDQQRATQNVRIGLDGLQKTASGLANGYAAVQGAMNLLNIENSNFEKAMIKVQSAMAIAQGVGGMKDLIEGAGTLKVAFSSAINGVKGFITSLSGVKAAIAATGIGVLVVAIGTLVANWDKLMGLIRKDNGEVEKLKTDFEDLKSSMVAKDEDFEFFIKMQEAAGKSRREVLKLKEEYASAKYDAAYDKYNELVDSLENYKPTFWDKVSGKDEKQAELAKLVEEAKNERDKLYKEWQNASNAIAVFDKEQGKESLENAKEINERARQNLIDTKEEELAELKRIYEQEKALLIQNGIDTILLTEEYLKKKKEIEDKYGGEVINNRTKQDGILSDVSIGESVDPYAMARTQVDNWIAYKIESTNKEKEIEQEKNDWLRNMYGDFFAFIHKKGGDTAGFVAAGFMESLYVASSIIGALQEGIDTTTKEGFEKNKKMQIANAVIQTLVGVTTALSGAFTTKSGPWDIALAAIQASTIAATGAIQVANIKKQTYDGADKGDLDSAAATPTAVTPNINLADSLPIQYSRELLSDTETTNLNQAQKVYVLESDITNTQNRVNVAESNSSF